MPAPHLVMARRTAVAVASAAALLLAGGAQAGAATGSPASRSAAGQEAWVATEGFDSGPGDTVTPVDLPDHRVDPAVTTASEPVALAVAGGGRSLLVANRGDDTLSVVDTATGAVTATVTVGLEPDAVAYVPGGAGGHGTALVANFGAGTVTPVDLATMRAGQAIPVGKQPDAIAVWAPTGSITAGKAAASTTTGGGVALVANFGDGTVTPIDLTTMQSGPAVSAGTEPDAIGIAPPARGGPATSTVRATALVADFGTDTVIPVDLATMADGPAVDLGGNPTAVTVADDGTAWVVNGATLTPLSASSTTAGSAAGLPAFAAGAPLALPGVGEAVALQGSVAWVALQDGSLISVTLPSGTVGRPVHVGGRPSAVVIP